MNITISTDSLFIPKKYVDIQGPINKTKTTSKFLKFVLMLQQTGLTNNLFDQPTSITA